MSPLVRLLLSLMIMLGLTACSPGLIDNSCDEDTDEDCEPNPPAPGTTYFGPDYWELELSDTSNQTFTLKKFETPESSSPTLSWTGKVDNTQPSGYTLLKPNDNSDDIALINASNQIMFCGIRPCTLRYPG